MELTTIVVQRKKDGFIGIIGRAFAFILGGLLTLIGALLFATIIGILPGLGLMMFGILTIMGAVSNTQTVECPHCKKKQNVQKDSEDYRCKRCEKPVIIDWRK